MKQTDFITVALAGVAVWLIWQSKQAKSTIKPTTSGTGFAVEILDPAGGQFANGWRYFSDGTTIDPAGNYYQGGQRIYTAPGFTV